ncbi:hypothetical protein [Nocardia asiatica]|uniref:hypothetical protein n=1 Tax=Nocardia asiatica TaxID=209252 RepID=UPI0002FBA149|nr:hypothetical protein [Nocardia asiatica]
MADEQSLEVLHQFVAQHSGYLRNIVRLPGMTCEVCACPISGPWTACYWCNQHRKMPGVAGIANRVGSIIYAVMGGQSYALMSGYKSSNPGPNQQMLVTVLAVLALQHLGCASHLGGQPVTQWATVPSLNPDRIGSLHPLRRILSALLSHVPEVVVAANPPIVSPRSLRPANFRIESPVTAGGHVLVVDDSWVQGGHAQSVCANMKQAGAQQVSMLTLSRVLDSQDKIHGPFVRDYLSQRAFDSRVCPWTGAGCPSGL